MAHRLIRFDEDGDSVLCSIRSADAPPFHKENRMLQKFITLVMVGRTNDEQGATAVEYGLLVALIAAVIITVVILLGGQINNAFTSITNKL